ncbi:MAG TPA: AAA family ATPase, partial [Kribbellaceae bacterium]
VSGEASMDQRAVTICLDEVDRCRELTSRPNFVLLLGDRYGWRPPPPAVSSELFRRLRSRLPPPTRRNVDRWYVEDLNAVPPVFRLQPRRGHYTAPHRWMPVERALQAALGQAAIAEGVTGAQLRVLTTSVTEQEVARGIAQGQLLPGAVHAFQRVTRGIPRDPSVGRYGDLIDGKPDDEASLGLRRLRAEVRRCLGPGQVHAYTAGWDAASGAPTTTHVDDLCEDVYQALAAVIETEARAAATVDVLVDESRQHAAFGRARSRHFTGRQQILDAVAAYVAGDDPHPLLVVGASGAGKTALLAEVARRLGTRTPEAGLIARFIGATPRSMELRTLVHDLRTALLRLRGAADATPEADLAALVDAFRTELAGSPPEPRLVLVLDALDQLNDAGAELGWLPTELPPGVRIVLSAQAGNTANAVIRHLGVTPLTLPAMPADEGDALLRRWLDEAGRDLQPPQRAAVLDAFASHGVPLHLRFAFEEARRWTSGTLVRPGTLASDIPGIIEQLLDRLEAEHGRSLVGGALGHLAASRNGLTEDEQLDLLSGDRAVLAEVVRRSPYSPAALGQLPPVLWARLYADLEPYLNVRQGDGRILLGFYHRQLTEVVAARYLSGQAAARVHRRLASYFAEQPLELTNGDRVVPNLRKLAELPYQQAHGGCWDELYETLTDFRFLERKVAADSAGVYALQDDFDLALRLWPTSAA